MCTRRVFGVLLLTLPILVSGCASPSADPGSASQSVTDRDYLTSDLWNDGKAEVAFYRVKRTEDQYGQDTVQHFTVGTYLVKQKFGPDEMTKQTDGTGVSSFKYALFYELESGSYQYKRNWVVNARQTDLRPYKQSFTSFDWCSNQYREMAFLPDGPVEVRMRSDDYGNRRDSFTYQAGYAPAQIPLLVRGFDFGSRDTLSFTVATSEGEYIGATATRVGGDSVETGAGTYDTERVQVQYEHPVPSMIGEESDTTETYWRATGPERVLVKMAAASGRYEMQLAEHLRSAYWEENLWPRLARIEDRP